MGMPSFVHAANCAFIMADLLCSALLPLIVIQLYRLRHINNVRVNEEFRIVKASDSLLLTLLQ